MCAYECIERERKIICTWLDIYFNFLINGRYILVGTGDWQFLSECNLNIGIIKKNKLYK